MRLTKEELINRRDQAKIEELDIRDFNYCSAYTWKIRKKTYEVLLDTYDWEDETAKNTNTKDTLKKISNLIDGKIDVLSFSVCHRQKRLYNKAMAANDRAGLWNAIDKRRYAIKQLEQIKECVDRMVRTSKEEEEEGAE